MNVHTVGPGVVSALPCHSSSGWWAVVPDHSLVQEGCGVPVLRERVPTWAGTQCYVCPYTPVGVPASPVWTAGGQVDMPSAPLPLSSSWDLTPAPLQQVEPCDQL